MATAEEHRGQHGSADDEGEVVDRDREDLVANIQVIPEGQPKDDKATHRQGARDEEGPADRAPEAVLAFDRPGDSQEGQTHQEVTRVLERDEETMRVVHRERCHERALAFRDARLDGHQEHGVVADQQAGRQQGEGQRQERGDPAGQRGELVEAGSQRDEPEGHDQRRVDPDRLGDDDPRDVRVGRRDAIRHAQDPAVRGCQYPDAERKRRCEGGYCRRPGDEPACSRRRERHRCPARPRCLASPSFGDRRQRGASPTVAPTRSSGVQLRVRTLGWCIFGDHAGPLVRPVQGGRAATVEDETQVRWLGQL